jgi:hypothetical protein
MIDENWILAMQDELNQFKRNEVWELVSCPKENQSLEPNGSLRTNWKKME